MRRARLSLPTPGSPRISKGTVGSTRWPIVTSWRSRAVFRTVVAQPGYRALLTLFLLIADDERRTRSKCGAVGKRARNTRSEEHTSELQSRLHLVCRLLLEKKKNDQTINYAKYNAAL